MVNKTHTIHLRREKSTSQKKVFSVYFGYTSKRGNGSIEDPEAHTGQSTVYVNKLQKWAAESEERIWADSNKIHKIMSHPLLSTSLILRK